MIEIIKTLVLGVLLLSFSVTIILGGVSLLVISEVVKADEVRRWLTRKNKEK